ncbi:hypothetical protein [Mucilaginibacter segetis]|uniref:Uncharacterized protein n=1 Tax=Mucilaginibacter segetis TaxID=2793071 RepID=A0A934UNB3_9SPHI|nr:hypothetical protein [Mucilaginibacter segetis]MBK0379732.1 hypothetical protein [Mucilaginibacter segetis]
MVRSPQVQDFPLLLEVFRGGLKLGLISREEVVLWADNIIANADDPHYFFIEVSLSHDLNNLIEVLNRYVEQTEDPICDRVLLSLVYHRQPIFDIDAIEKVATLLGSMSLWNKLTSFEKNTIYEFEDYYVYYSPDLTQLQVELINFLGIYKAFTLENYKQWVDINLQVSELLKEEEVKVNIVNQSVRKAWAKKEKKRKLKFYLKKIGAIVLLLGFFSLMIALLDDGKTNHITLYFIVFYLFIRLVYGWWRKR